MPMGALTQNSECGSIPRTEISEEVRMLIKQLNTCLQMETRERRSLVVAYAHDSKACG